MKAETSVQRSGWIVWWINTVLYALMIIAMIWVYFRISDRIYDQRDQIFSIGVGIFMLVFMIALQIIAFFMIKYLHRDDSYIYPIILVVIAFFGLSLYFIPGIWGILYTNHKKLNS